MTCNNLKVLNIFAHLFSYSVRNELMRRAVETVAANSIFFIIFVRNSIHICLWRHSTVERCIKNKYLRNIRTYNFKASPVAHKMSRIVKRSKRSKFFNILNNLFCNENTLSISIAALYYSVTYSVDFAK